MPKAGCASLSRPTALKISAIVGSMGHTSWITYTTESVIRPSKTRWLLRSERGNSP
jgi:hypothetical protein